jgi:hypothetical protein
MLVPPSGKAYSFPKNVFDPQKPKSTSQIGQEDWIMDMFGRRTGLFLVESGAYDGSDDSNSLMLEVTRGWECLLVEPSPSTAQKVVNLNRKCHTFRGGLSETGQRKKIQVDTNGEKTSGSSGNAPKSSVDAYPLEQILLHMGRRTVDYWSLDTEGTELGIIKNFPFRHTTFSPSGDEVMSGLITVGVMTVEHNSHDGPRKGIFEELTRKGFKRAHAGKVDDYYVNPTYLEDNGMSYNQWSKVTEKSA